MKTDWCIPSLRGVLGDWIYYAALLNAKQISERIVPFHEIREAQALEDFLQRTLKPRVSKIANYLCTHDSRFFNSIIIGIWDGLPQWAEFDLRTIAKKMKLRETDSLKESLGLLVFAGHEKMFAIDGQHRVKGIELAYKKDKKRLSTDQYPVIFVAYLDTVVGKVRTRRLFCDINKNAVAVSEGDKVIIDEDDLPAIVTRKVYVTYPPFRKGMEIAVTERKEVIEKDGKEHFTSLLAIYTVTKKLKKLFRKKQGTLERDPQNVREFEPIVTRFFDFVIRHEASLKRYFKLRNTTLRAQRKNNRNLFFRPVGLEILARLFVHFSLQKTLHRLATGLKEIDFGNPGGVFDGILWTNGRISAGAEEKSAAVDLCLYVLGELTTQEKHELLHRLRNITKNPHYRLPPRI